MHDECKGLRDLAECANLWAHEVFLARNTCINTSAAIRDVLDFTCGVPARLLRVEARLGTRILGYAGYGPRYQERGDGWPGHLVVIAKERFLIDATLDQIAPKGVRVRPFVAVVSDEFLAGQEDLRGPVNRRHNSPVVRYRALPHWGGWRRAPAFQRKNRQELIDCILMCQEHE